MPDTSLRLAFMGVNSQRTTIQLGTAVYNACENLKQEMIRTAVATERRESGRMDVVEGYVCRAERSFSFAEIVRLLGPDATIKSVGAYRAPPVQVDSSSFAGMDHWAPSAAIAEVEVDPDTGEFGFFNMQSRSMPARCFTISRRSRNSLAEPSWVWDMPFRGSGLLRWPDFEWRSFSIPSAGFKDLPSSMQTSIVEGGTDPVLSVLKECLRLPSLRLHRRSVMRSTMLSERRVRVFTDHAGEDSRCFGQNQ